MAAFLTTLVAHPIIILFLFLNLAIGFWAHSKSKANSFEDYALASRSLPTGVLVMTLLGTFVARGDIAQPGYIHFYGIIDVLVALSIVCTFLVIGTFIAPYLVYFRGHNTLGDLMNGFYGSISQIISGCIGCFIALMMITSQLEAIGEITSYMLKVNSNIAMIAFGLLIIFYSASGGMRAVSYTDVLQIILALLVFSWVAQAMLQKVGGLQKLVSLISEKHSNKLAIFDHPKLSYKIRSSIFWGPSCSFALSFPIVQRMLMTQNKRQVRSMWYLSSLFYLIILSLLVTIGLTTLSLNFEFSTSLNKRLLLPHLIQNLFQTRSWVVDLMFIGLLGILFSTIDSYLHAVGISFVQDLINPVRKALDLKPLGDKQKGVYAQISVVFIGVMSILMGYFLQDSILAKYSFYQYAVLVSSIITTPLVIGIIGVKTEKASFISFAFTYLLCISLFHLGGMEWHIYDVFLISLPLATLAYFLTHIYINGGILTLKRSEQTIAEQLWIPTWQGSVEYLKSWLLAPFRLHILASRKIVNNPTQSLSFSMLIFALYTFSSVMTGGSNDLGIANFMAGVHLVGITLCVGLMLEGIWPDRLKPYFALYWFFTLFYCLAFGSTLTFLREHEDMMAVIKWFFNFMLLAFLVDSISFITLTCLGSSLAMGVWYAVFRSIPSDVLGSIGLPGIYLLAGLLVAVLLFASSREQHVNQRFDWNRTASSALGHDLRLTVGMLEGVGRALENAFKVSESMTNTKGEKGYWVPQGQAAFLGSFSEKMIERGAMAGKEIQDFSDFIKSQVVGIFEQKKTGMRAAAEEAIHKLEDKMPSTVKMKVSGKKDFSPKVLSGVFTNVFYNLLWNAATHGKASEVEIRIDGDKRTITVLDNGKGIPSDILPRIFDLNFSTGMKRTKNSGVGLAFVKMVIAASSGKISCHSRHGDKGSFTEFVMEFPEV